MRASCFAILLSAVSGACAVGQELPTFTAETRLVEVYATVADSKGRFVEGLQRDQFTVRDNGSLSRSPCSKPGSPPAFLRHSDGHHGKYEERASRREERYSALHRQSA